MRILTHTFRKHSFRIVLTLYLVFTSNLKKKNYYPNKFKFTCLFQLLFPNLLNYSQLKLIKLMELVQGGGGRKKKFRLQLTTWHWYQPDTPELVHSTRNTMQSRKHIANHGADYISNCKLYCKIACIRAGHWLWMIPQLPHWLPMILKTQMIC